MAVTGNIAGSFNGSSKSFATPYIFWSYEQSIPNNNTVLNAELKVKREKTGSTTYKVSTPWSIDIGETKKSGTTNFKITNVSAGQYITIGSLSKTLTHKDDGSIDPISISATIDISGTTLGTGSVSTSIPINTIPRASQPTLSANSIDIGSAVTINMNRVSTSFTHYVYAQWASKKVEIGSNITDNVSWTLPMDFCNDIPSSPSGWGTIYVDTYSNGTYVGTKSVGFTGTVPASVIPNIGDIILSEANSNVSPLGVLVQGKSSLNVNIATSGKYGSWITNCRVDGIDNTSYWSTKFTSAVLQQAGERTVTVTVTDSRGKTATKTAKYTCVAYSNPSISVATVTRCNADGTDNEEGTTIKYSFKASISPVNSKNTCYYQLGYKKSTDSTYTYLPLTLSDYNLNVKEWVEKAILVDIDNSYDFEFVATDYFTTTSIERNIGTGFTLMDFRYTGKGIGIGKVSEKDALEIGMPTELIGGINGDIISNDNNSKWQINGNVGATPIPGSGCGILSGGDGANETTANMKLYSWFGIGFSPSISGLPIPQGENAVYINTRNGDLTARGKINGYKLNSACARGVTGASTVSHTNYGTNHNNLPDMTFLSYWNGAYASSGASNLSRCSTGPIVGERARSIVANTDNTSSHIVLGNLLICWGRTLITPSANNTPTVKALTFPKSFAVIPMVLTGACSAVPGTKVTGTSATNITTTGCDIYVTRTNTTDTAVNWLAIGQVS